MKCMTNTFRPNSKESTIHISKYNIFEVAKVRKRQPVDTFRNVGWENVNKLARLPGKPIRNIIR